MFVLGTGKWPGKGTLKAKDSALKANFYERTYANLTTGIRRGCGRTNISFTEDRRVVWHSPHDMSPRFEKETSHIIGDKQVRGKNTRWFRIIVRCPIVSRSEERGQKNSTITTILFVQPSAPPPCDCAPPISAWLRKDDCEPSPRIKRGARRSQHG
jgi:hypothetical protein